MKQKLSLIKLSAEELKDVKGAAERGICLCALARMFCLDLKIGDCNPSCPYL